MIQNRKYQALLLGLIVCFAVGCSTQKRKGEVSKFKKFYHTFTSKYNGYFNANELMKESIATLEASHQDNFNQILPVYTYVEADNPKSVASDLDLAIEKVTRVATIHSVGDYVDDCYVLMGKAQYLKQDYETAEETFQYFQQEFDPKNPNGSNYKNKAKSSKQKKKEREIERKNKKKELEEAKKEERKRKDEERKVREKKKKEEKKAKEKERERIQKEREEEKKRKKKERERAKKGKKKKKKGKRLTREERAAAKKAKEAAEKAAKEKAAAEKAAKELADKQAAEEEVNKIEPVIDPVDESTGEPKEIDEEEEKDSKDEKKDKKEEDDTAYSEGMLWMARTYIEREKYSNAEFILRKLDQSTLKKDVRREVAPAYAHLYISQKEYDKAIPWLDKAIETAKDGKLKARYAYILAQLYQKKKDYANALMAFEQVKKHKGDFRMDFNADLSIAKNGLLSGSESAAQASSKIDRMLKEDKYEEFRDQIYFTLGELAVAQNNKPEALKNFRLSVQNNTENGPLLTEAYYQIAQLSLVNEEYVDAKYYYDSTLLHMPKQDERHIEVSRYAANLSNIAKYIESIDRQDSLLRISEMSEDEQRKIAEKIIIEEKKKAADVALAKANSPNKNAKAGMVTDRRGKTSRARALGESKFFAYNLKSKEKSLKDFKKQWGDRNLDDNWRRSSTQTFAIAEDGEEVEETIEISDAEMKRALKDVPSNPAQIKEAHDIIANAMYKLGVEYRTKIENNEKCVATLESLLQKYPDTDKKLDAYYNLYLAYQDMGKQSMANSYKKKLAEEFPDSQYAKILSDPNYLAELNDESNSVEKYYSNTYAYFDQGAYDKVRTRITDVPRLFGMNNPLKAKFSLLNAMVTGKEGGKDAYLKALQEVITRNPNTPEETRAKEIMRFLRGDGQAFDPVDIKEVDGIFDFEPDKLHYAAVVVYAASPDEFTDAKIAISNFNKKYYKTKKLQMQDIFLNKKEGVQLILVRKFKNKDEGMDYLNTVQKNAKDYVDSKLSYDIYPITQRNYRKMVSERSAKKYKVFFENKYKDN